MRGPRARADATREDEAGPARRQSESEVEPEAPVAEQTSAADRLQRALARPQLMTSADLLALQRAVGNRAVRRWAARQRVERSPGPSVRRVVALPSSDFEIHGAGSEKLLPDGAPSRVFFDLNATGPVDAKDTAIQSVLLYTKAKDPLVLNGYASEDEVAANPKIIDQRLDAVAAVLVAGGHDAATITRKPMPLPGRLDYRRVRSVEILASGEKSVEPVKGARANEPCLPKSPQIDAAFQDAKRHVINDFIDPVLKLLGSPVVSPSALESGLNDFFHGPAHAAEVKTNLEKIKAEISRLTTAGNYSCGTMNDSACAGGAIAYNDEGHVVVCPGYVPLAGTLTQAQKDDHARNLLHEAAHSTAGLVGVVGSPPGTQDFGYRHERMIKLLPVEKQLQNSDSYGLFVLQVQGGIISAAPPVDVAGAGLDTAADKPKFDKAELAVARLQKWAASASQWIAQVYGDVQKLVTLPAGDPKKTWKDRFSKPMEFAADAGFPLTKPPGLPAAGEEVKLAAINDRLQKMRGHLQDSINISLAPAGYVGFTLGSPVKLTVNDAFLAAATTDDQRADMLLKELLQAMPWDDVSIDAVPVYAALVSKIRVEEGL